MQARFVARLEQLIEQKQSRLILMLNPQILRMPLPMKRHDDPFLPFSKEIIKATRGLVCGYMFDLASYMRLGAAGMIALERSMNYAHGDSLLILHGPFAGSAFVDVIDENAFGADALTLVDTLSLNDYLQRDDRSAFVINSQPMTISDAPQSGGFFWTEQRTLTTMGNHGEVISLKLLADEVLYADASEDYAQVVRSWVEKSLE